MVKYLNYGCRREAAMDILGISLHVSSLLPDHTHHPIACCCSSSCASSSDMSCHLPILVVMILHPISCCSFHLCDRSTASAPQAPPLPPTTAPHRKLAPSDATRHQKWWNTPPPHVDPHYIIHETTVAMDLADVKCHPPGDHRRGEGATAASTEPFHRLPHQMDHVVIRTKSQ